MRQTKNNSDNLPNITSGYYPTGFSLRFLPFSSSDKKKKPNKRGGVRKTDTPSPTHRLTDSLTVGSSLSNGVCFLCPADDLFSYIPRQGKKKSGVFTYSSGGRYIGELQSGKRHGSGSFLYPDGSSYEGQWQENVKHGAYRIIGCTTLHMHVCDMASLSHSLFAYECTLMSLALRGTGEKMSSTVRTCLIFIFRGADCCTV